MTLEEYLTQAHVQWHGTTLNQPDWGIDSHSVAFTMQDDSVAHARYIAINAYWEALKFRVASYRREARFRLVSRHGYVARFS